MGYLTYLAVVLLSEKDRFWPAAVVPCSRPGQALFSSTLLGLRVRTLKDHSFSLTALVTPPHGAPPQPGCKRRQQSRLSMTRWPEAVSCPRTFDETTRDNTGNRQPKRRFTKVSETW